MPKVCCRHVRFNREQMLIILFYVHVIHSFVVGTDSACMKT